MDAWNLLQTYRYAPAAVRPPSAVHFAEDRVDAADHRDQVGDEPPLRHQGQRLQVDEGGRAHVDPVGLAAPVADDVEADLPLRRLDTDVDLALRRLVALADDLEVVDERLHAGRQLGA